MLLGQGFSVLPHWFYNHFTQKIFGSYKQLNNLIMGGDPSICKLYIAHCMMCKIFPSSSWLIFAIINIMRGLEVFEQAFGLTTWLPCEEVVWLMDIALSKYSEQWAWDHCKKSLFILCNCIENYCPEYAIVCFSEACAVDRITF